MINNSELSSMLKSKIILVIDNDEIRRQQIATVLAFVGEEFLAFSEDDFYRQKSVLAKALTVIVCGDISAQFQQLIKSYPQCPFIFHELPDQQLVSHYANMIGGLTTPLNYAQLTELIHLSHHYHNNLPSKKRASGVNPALSSLVGTSEAMQQVRFLIEQVASTNANVLILGESGTGKEVVARNIHNLSDRKKAPFVPVNCGAIPPDLLESELFGHEKGAFTGAISTRKGRFEMAEGGTLFLDEIGDMPQPMQVKLLRVLQERVFERVGGAKSIKADVRIIAATHQHLEAMIKENKFREDLLFRLNVFPIQVPTLRERSDDIPEIVSHFLKDNSYVNANEAPFGFDKSGLEALTTYEWPGNIRELRNILERAKVFFPGQNINREQVTQTLLGFNQNAFFDHVEENENVWSVLDELGGAERGHEADERAPPTAKDFSRLFDSSNSVDVRRLLRDVEIVLIEKALERNAGNTSEAAKDLHLQRTTLIEKIKKYGL